MVAQTVLVAFLRSLAPKMRALPSQRLAAIAADAVEQDGQGSFQFLLRPAFGHLTDQALGFVFSHPAFPAALRVIQQNTNFLGIHDDL